MTWDFRWAGRVSCLSIYTLGLVRLELVQVSAWYLPLGVRYLALYALVSVICQNAQISVHYSCRHSSMRVNARHRHQLHFPLRTSSYYLHMDRWFVCILVVGRRCSQSLVKTQIYIRGRPRSETGWVKTVGA